MVSEQDIINVIRNLESRYGKQKTTITHIGRDYFNIHIDAPNKSAYVSLVLPEINPI